MTTRAQLLAACIAQGRCEIIEDIASGRVPTVNSFDELHYYVDGNEYGGFTAAWVTLKNALDGTDEGVLALAEETQEALHAWITSGAMQAAVDALNKLRSLHPELTFDVVPSADVLDDVSEVPAVLLTLERDGESTFDPYASPCGRFEVSPDTYALSAEAAQVMRAHNCVSAL